MNLLEGNIKKTLLHFALPMILSLMIQQLYNVVDMIIVGRYLGVKDLAAVGNASMVVMILVTLSGGLEMGSEVIFAKYSALKNHKDIVIGVKSILTFGLISGVCITALGFLLKTPILTWIKVPQELISGTGMYSIYLSGIVVIFLYDIARAILLALGNPKIAMLLVILSSVLNIALDLLFICIFRMGVGGAALATILSQFVGMLVALLALKRKIRSIDGKCQYPGIEWGKIREILSISLPTILQQFVLSLSSILLLALVNPYGSEVISGFLTVNKIMLFGMLVIMGISQALAIFTSSNYSSGNLGRIREGYRYSMKAATLYTTVIITANYVLPKHLIGVFLDTEKNVSAYEFAKDYLQWSSLTYFLYGWKIINESILRGSLRMKSFLVSNLSDLFGRTFLTYLLVELFSLQGFWMGGLFGKLISFMISGYVILKSLQIISRDNVQPKQ